MANNEKNIGETILIKNKFILVTSINWNTVFSNFTSS
jgi:hypothetical protein